MKVKYQRLITISVVGTISSFLLYFGLGLVGISYVDNALFDVRGSTVKDLETIDYLIEKGQRDYPILQNRKYYTFPYNNETLMGYLYECENPKGVIISAHGVNSLADSTAAEYQQYFLSQGWDVFSFDEVGCGRSSGEGMEGLFASRYCVGSAIEKVKTIQETKDLPICLIGHSWGAYGVLTASGDYSGDIKAVASFSGYDTPEKAMVELAYNYVSPSLMVTKPAMDFGLKFFHGNKAYYSSARVVQKNQNINYVIVQGELDKVVTKKSCVYSELEKKNLDNVTLAKLPNMGHMTPWKSDESEKYLNDFVYPRMNEIKKQYGDDIPSDVLASFLETINKEKTSEPNYDLLDQINNIFLDSVI